MWRFIAELQVEPLALSVQLRKSYEALNFPKKQMPRLNFNFIQVLWFEHYFPRQRVGADIFDL